MDRVEVVLVAPRKNTREKKLVPSISLPCSYIFLRLSFPCCFVLRLLS